MAVSFFKYVRTTADPLATLASEPIGSSTAFDLSRQRTVPGASAESPAKLEEWLKARFPHAYPILEVVELSDLERIAYSSHMAAKENVRYRDTMRSISWRCR